MGYYAMAGIKACFPFNYFYTSEIASYNNAAYYPDFDNWINSLPILGLGSFNGNRASEKLKFDILPFFAFEAGAKWRIKTGFLYTGVYFDYGLNNFTGRNRVLYSDYYPEQNKEKKLSDLTDTMNLMAAGIQMRLAFFRTQSTCSYRWWRIKK